MIIVASVAVICSLAFAIFFVPAFPVVVALGVFGFDVYRQVTDKRPMSVRIHEYCVKVSRPYDEAAINNCKFRVLQRELNASIGSSGGAMPADCGAVRRSTLS